MFSLDFRLISVDVDILSFFRKKKDEGNEEQARLKELEVTSSDQEQSKGELNDENHLDSTLL